MRKEVRTTKTSFTRSLAKKPTTYRKWLRRRYQIEELGVKAFMTDKMVIATLASRYEVSNMIANLLSKSFGRAIVEGGYSLPFNVFYERERDPSLRVWEHLFVTENYMEMLPEQYMIMAFDAWNGACSSLIGWEKKSLWQYLRYWCSREIQPYISQTWQSIKKKLKINQYD